MKIKYILKEQKKLIILNLNKKILLLHINF